MTALERLLLEAVPTGRFGGTRQPSRPDPDAAARIRELADAVWPPDPHAARHRADLEAALDESRHTTPNEAAA